MAEETYDLRQEFKGIDPIIQLIARQIDRIMSDGTKKNIELYIEGIERLIDLLPPETMETILEYKKEHNVVYNVSQEGKVLWVDLFRFIKVQLSRDNIIWKRSRYEMGRE
jgi:hypothetical protein